MAFKKYGNEKNENLSLRWDLIQQSLGLEASSHLNIRAIGCN